MIFCCFESVRSLGVGSLEIEIEKETTLCGLGGTRFSEYVRFSVLLKLTKYDSYPPGRHIDWVYVGVRVMRVQDYVKG